jgi:carboxypeptidase family protein/TonB-dependent receptor-like protein
MNSVSRFALAIVLALTLPAGVGAQTASATLRGRVYDAQHAAVPAAVVTVSVRDTGQTRTVTTDADGTFVAPSLPPGVVDVSVAAPGFREAKREGVTLEVGQTASLVVELSLENVRVNVNVEGGIDLTAVDTSRSVVDTVIPAALIDVLPLNGRNFLELSLLVPGNTPAPNFDPTKSNTVAISSAGQLGRGGNITIDGADNNDDVVGGPLMNVTEESVQEFQIATNRFTAETGRSASSAINVVTKSGGEQLRGSASLFARDRRWQSLPATYDKSSGAKPPFDRQQISGAIGGPLAPGAFWFAAAEDRNQDGATLVGTRDVAQRAIRRSFAPAPLDDLLGSGRVDWHPDGSDSLMARYSGEHAEDTGASTLDRSIGSASYRQSSVNRYQAVVGSWTRIVSPRIVNAFSTSYSTYHNRIEPVTAAPQLTFPSLVDGASFRVPQGTIQKRFQVSNSATLLAGAHTIRTGGEWQRVLGQFDLDVFRQGRVELVEDFADFDHNGDGRIDDNDLLFAVTLRSGKPDQSLSIPDANNNYVAMFVQDDWRVRSDLTLNLGVRYELDTDVKNISRVADINPLVEPFLKGKRGKDLNNIGPRLGFNWAPGLSRTSVHGGYGIYYDRMTLELQSLERGLDGRALPIEVRAGNALFVDPATGRFPAFAPSLANPFTGFILPGAGASGINIIDNGLENPTVQQFNLGLQHALPGHVVLRVDGVHNLGTHFIIGRTIGTVENPVVGGPDRVVNLESSVNTHYDALLVSAEQRGRRAGFRVGYALSKALNYANDDQIPFANGPIDPNDLRREYGPTPNDQRHRLTLAAWGQAPGGFLVAPIWTLASAVPMDILMPDAQSRVPAFQRNAGGRLFKSAADLNKALTAINSSGGVSGQLLPLVPDSARFGDAFNSLDLRVSRPFALRHVKLEPTIEVFNLFNVTNILGVSVKNYSGYSNVLVRDSSDPGQPGYLRSSSFGQPVSTAGGVFGSGGPRALQLAVRTSF